MSQSGQLVVVVVVVVLDILQVTYHGMPMPSWDCTVMKYA